MDRYLPNAGLPVPNYSRVFVFSWKEKLIFIDVSLVQIARYVIIVYKMLGVTWSSPLSENLQ